MGGEVYANSDEIACKAGDGKVIAAFPDVCLSPPSPPAGPIPIPYPNTSFSKDMQNGSKTVMIKDKEIMLKDQSFYQTSPLGDEAATNGLGASVITHVITGKTYFVAWSMDVQFEGQNVDRHLDLTTSNHASQPGSTPPAPNAEMMALAAQRREQGLCECCGQPRHASQEGADAVSEEEWYNLNEQIPDDPPPPSVQHKRLIGEWEAKKAELKKQRQALNRRQRIVAKSKKCPSSPQPPCNTYRKITSEQTAMAEAEWGAASSDYKDRMNVPFVKSTKKDPKTGKKVPMRGKVDHKVPKSAGGCPTGDGNLQPHHAMSKDCQDADDELGKIQTECATKWDAEIKAGS
jgi:hypothetical protein